MDWATFWSIFSRTHLATLVAGELHLHHRKLVNEWVNNCNDILGQNYSQLTDTASTARGFCPNEFCSNSFGLNKL
jgi:hypothetical protein